MADRELQIIIKAEVDKALANLKKVDNSMGGLGKAAGVLKGGMLAVGAAMIGVAAASVKSSADFEKQQVAFEVMLGSAEKAKKLLGEIEQFAATTPFQMPGLIEGSKRLLAFGTSAGEVVGKMKNLGNAAMGNQATLDRLVDAYGKVQAKGKASLEELNRFTEAGVPILKELQTQYGVTETEMFNLISTGKVGFEDVDKALTSLTTGTGKFAGMIERQSQTMHGLFSTLQDNIGLIAKDIGDSFAPAIKEDLAGAIEFLQDSKDDIVRGFSTAFHTITGIVKDAWTFIQEVGASFSEIFELDTDTETALNNLDEILSNISAGLSVLFEVGKNVFESVFKTAKTIIDSVVTGFEELFGDVDDGNIAFTILAGAAETVSLALSILGKFVKFNIDLMVDLFQIVKEGAGIFQALGTFFTDPIKGLEMMDQAVKNIGESFVKLGSRVVENVADIIKTGQEGFQNFSQNTSDMAAELMEKQKEIYDESIKQKQDFIKKSEELEQETLDEISKMKEEKGKEDTEKEKKRLKELKAEYEKWSNVVTNQIGNVFSSLGEALASGEDATKAFAQAGLNAIASIIEAIGQEFLARAAGAAALALIPPPFGTGPAGFAAAAGLAGAGALAMTAGGVVRGFAGSFEQGGSFMTDKPTIMQVGDNTGAVERVTVEPVSSFGSNNNDIIVRQPLVIQIDTGVLFKGLLEASRSGIALLDGGAIVYE